MLDRHWFAIFLRYEKKQKGENCCEQVQKSLGSNGSFTLFAIIRGTNFGKGFWAMLKAKISSC
jgi:hypothetical protein